MAVRRRSAYAQVPVAIDNALSAGGRDISPDRVSVTPLAAGAHPGPSIGREALS